MSSNLTCTAICYLFWTLKVYLDLKVAENRESVKRRLDGTELILIIKYKLQEAFNHAELTRPGIQLLGSLHNWI